ncbi:hypothetical protein [Jiella avicenniae]|uniref:Uncharacterized protein n=1 Tax=Jiella avicenniae TaxID=2907202 RepID=A0A9X1P3N9_9HYPH|nr:hypothetical protein [Jiella avicenniae]MCE7029179.1 hypothetical protein [Jiella avicenniae]
MHGPIAGAFTASFLLFWLAFAGFFLATIIRLSKSGEAKYVFGLKEKPTPQALDASIRAMTEYFSTRFGRLHGIALGILAMTTIALGLWALVDNKNRNAPAAEATHTNIHSEI